MARLHFVDHIVNDIPPIPARKPAQAHAGGGCSCGGARALSPRDRAMARASVAYLGDRAPKDPTPRHLVDAAPCACQAEVADMKAAKALVPTAKLLAYDGSSDGRDAYMARMELAHLRRR